MVSFYRSVPAIVEYGLLVIFGGAGSIQLIATIAYWAVVRPAAVALEVIRLYFVECPGAFVGLSAVLATEAHFYWTWAMLEVAIRRRPLWQRIFVVLLLGVVLLPIPGVQVLLAERSVEQVVVGSVLGNLLGISFFFGLRLTGVWSSLLVSRKSFASGGMMSHWLQPRDNLTNFWGGSVWPKQVYGWPFHEKEFNCL